MVGWVGKMAAGEADVEMTSMGIISSSQASALVSSPRLYGHHCFPPLPRTAGSYRADTLEICAIITLSSAWNVYSNNQTYGVIPIDLDFPRARVINRTDRNVCDARNDRSRWLDLNLALITSGWSAPSSDLLISRRPEPIINRLIVFLQSNPLIR